MTAGPEEHPVDDLAIAVVGMAGRFPGARDLDEYWDNLRSGVCSVTWLNRAAVRSDGASPAMLDDNHYVPAAYLLEGSDRFDAEFFGYSPREAELLDPQHRVFLECAWATFEDAGMDTSRGDHIVGVWAGAGHNTYLTHHVMSHPDITSVAGEKQVLVGNRADYLTSRVAYKLGLTGPAVTIQTACSTSLVAVANACQSLLAFECDVALAGGVAVAPDRRHGYLYEEDGILSPDGFTRTLDSRAGGTVGGDGVGAIALKRLDDALAEGDHIHAVIRGFAVNNDGANRVGFSAPNSASQAAVVRRAMNSAYIEPTEVQYVELHGTATALGDPIEMAALRDVFADAPSQSTYVGSAKANVGHLDAAAGVAGLIKTVLALEHRMIPPLPHFAKPNALVKLDASPFRVATEAVPWPDSDVPRRAGVSSFGLGGTNAHVIVEQAPRRPTQGQHAKTAQLIVCSGRTAVDADRVVARLRAALERCPQLSLSDAAQTLQHGRHHFAHRRAVVVDDLADALEALDSDDGRILQGVNRSEHGRPVAFLVGGFGAERPGMARELYDSERVFRSAIDECLGICAELGIDLSAALLEEQPDTYDHPVHRPSIGYPAVFAFEFALTVLWKSWGVIPAAMAGHSLGDYLAAHLAGVLGLCDALRLVIRRAQLLEDHAAGAMIAIALPESEIEKYLSSDVSIAVINDSFSCVLAGTSVAIDLVSRELDQDGVVGQLLSSPYAFHSPLVEGALDEYRSLVGEVRLSAPTIPFVSNLTGTWITDEEATDPDYWVRHMREPVRFANAVGQLWSLPEVVMVEIGLGQTLTAGAMQSSSRRNLGDGIAVASLPGTTLGQSSARASLLRAAGRLWLSGVVTPFPPDSDRRRVRLPTYPFNGPRYWIERSKSRSQDSQQRRGDGVESWFYTPTWWRAPRSAANSGHIDCTWLVFQGSQQWCADLVAELRGSGRSIVSVAAGKGWIERPDSFELDVFDPHHLAQLAKRLTGTDRVPDRVVFTWPVDGEGFAALVRWAQACQHWLESNPQRWDVVTARTLPFASHDTLLPAEATVSGFCRVLGQEYPHVICVQLDLGAGEERQADLAGRVLSELLAAPKDSEVILASGRRWARGYRQQIPGEESGQRVRPGGRYIVTGGLGRIGRTVTRVLAETQPVHISLLARSAPETLPADIQALQTGGTTVDLRQVDVADQVQVRKAVDEIINVYGGVDGLVHCAGVTGAAAHASIPDIRPSDLKEQLGAKLDGASNLRLALDGQRLDFAILCSSISSVLGGLEFATYAAANSALDAFAARWWSPLQPWCSVGWEAWAFAAQDGSADRRLGASVRDFALHPDEGADVLRRILRSDQGDRVVVSTGDLESRIATWRAPAGASTGTTVHERPHLHTPFAAASTPIEIAIADVWSQILGISEVGVNDNFFELGGSSLLGLQVVHRLRSVFKVSLALTSIYEAPTVRSLAAFISGHDEGLVTR